MTRAFMVLSDGDPYKGPFTTAEEAVDVMDCLAEDQDRARMDDPIFCRFDQPSVYEVLEYWEG